MAGFENNVMVAKNMNFDTAAVPPHLGELNAAGKLAIGTGNTFPTAEILGGSLTSPLGTLSIGYSSPNITLDVIGGSTAIDSIQVDAATPPGTNPVVPTVAGLIIMTGGQVANGVGGANVIRTQSLAANTVTVDVQRSAASASSNLAVNGVAHFDSTSFAVDANGFVTSTGGGFTWNDVSGAFSALKNNGYFVTATATGTLPASPAQGDTIKFFVDHDTQVLTIDAPGTQIIRLGVLVSSAGGTAVSTVQGDSVELVYRAADTCWCAIAGFTGTWVMA